jgi:transposase
MQLESKAILGQRIGRRLYLSDDEKRLIIKDFLSGNQSSQSVYERYTGYSKEHGKISKWMSALGIEAKSKKSVNLVTMPRRKKDIKVRSDEFEALQLKKRIEELEKQLQTAEMKAIAFSTMVDIAEKEFNIPIRKKYNTKPSK